MSLISGLCVRPDPARKGLAAVRAACVLSFFTLAGHAGATTLSINSARVTLSNNLSAPAAINPVANGYLASAQDRAIMTGSVGPVTRATWFNEGLGGEQIRFIMSGHINDGVSAGDDVRFIYRFSIVPSAGTASWIIRATAAAPPSQGFILGDNGTVFAFNGGGTIEGALGRTFSSASTNQGDFSFAIDVSWSGTSDPNATLHIVVHEAQVHLPTPFAGSLLLLAAAIRSRRRRHAH